MQRILSRLIVFNNLAHDPVISGFSQLYVDKERFEEQTYGDLPEHARIELALRANDLVHQLLEASSELGFDHDLWCDYLAYQLLCSDNCFSRAAKWNDDLSAGTISEVALLDMASVLELATWDFTPLAIALKVPAVEVMRMWTALPREESPVLRAGRAFSEALGGAATAEDAYGLLVDAYRKLG